MCYKEMNPPVLRISKPCLTNNLSHFSAATFHGGKCREYVRKYTFAMSADAKTKRIRRWSKNSGRRRSSRSEDSLFVELSSNEDGPLRESLVTPVDEKNTETKNLFLRWKQWCRAIPGRVKNWNQERPERTCFYGYFGFASVLMACLLVFYVTLAHTSYGVPERLSCFSHAWQPMPRMCGLNAAYCGPFTTEWSPLRCPYSCAWPDKRQKVYGSANSYRADSYICRAAINSGKLSGNGGCALWRMNGQKRSFLPSTANGINTLGFPFWFPASLEFKEVDSSMCAGGHFQYMLLAMGIVLLSATTVFWDVKNIATVSVQVWPALIFAMFYLGLIDTPKPGSPGITIAQTCQRSVILAPILYLMYLLNVDHAFGPLNNKSISEDTVEETDLLEDESSKRLVKPGWWKHVFLFLVPLFLILHMHYLTYVLPDFDISGELFRNGGKYNNVKSISFALVLLLLILFLVAYHFRAHYKQGTLVSTLKIYGAIIATVLLFCLILGGDYSLHAHHSFLGFVLFLGTRVKRSYISLVCAALCMGMVINGIIKYSWDGSLFDRNMKAMRHGEGSSAGGASSGGHQMFPRIRNLSLTDTSVNIVWQKNFSSPKPSNVFLYMNNILVHQQSLEHAPMFTITNMLPSTNYFFWAEYTSFDTMKTFYRSQKLYVTTLNT